MDDVIRGQWRQVKGRLRRAWGELTEDDVARTDGDVETLIGRIQERYGIAKEKAREEVAAFVQEFKRGEAEGRDPDAVTPR